MVWPLTPADEKYTNLLNCAKILIRAGAHDVRPPSSPPKSNNDNPYHSPAAPPQLFSLSCLIKERYHSHLCGASPQLNWGLKDRKYFDVPLHAACLLGLTEVVEEILVRRPPTLVPCPCLRSAELPDRQGQ